MSDLESSDPEQSALDYPTITNLNAVVPAPHTHIRAAMNRIPELKEAYTAGYLELGGYHYIRADKEPDHCVCGETIRRVYEVVDTRSGLRYSVGCICILRVIPKPIVDEFNEEMRDANKKHCAVCGAVTRADTLDGMFCSEHRDVLMDAHRKDIKPRGARESTRSQSLIIPGKHMLVNLHRTFFRATDKKQIAIHPESENVYIGTKYRRRYSPRRSSTFVAAILNLYFPDGEDGLDEAEPTAYPILKRWAVARPGDKKIKSIHQT